MVILKCRHCQGEISSGSRQVQCPHCGTLFPFVCAKCNCNLRTPFPVYSDERYLSLDNEPLCSEHFIRMCPDCNTWFSASDNPGFFRCAACAEKHAQTRQADWDEEDEFLEEEELVAEEDDEKLGATEEVRPRPAYLNIPILVALVNLLTRLVRGVTGNQSQPLQKEPPH